MSQYTEYTEFSDVPYPNEGNVINLAKPQQMCNKQKSCEGQPRVGIPAWNQIKCENFQDDNVVG